MTIDINKIVTDLNGKADVDLTNVVGAMSESAKNYFSGAGMPSDNYIDLTLGASGSEYTAPANGWFSLYTSNIYNFQLFNTSKNYGITSYGKSGLAGSCTLPVNRGDVVKATYDSSTAVNSSFRFIYSVGSESEAQ